MQKLSLLGSKKNLKEIISGWKGLEKLLEKSKTSFLKDIED